MNIDITPELEKEFKQFVLSRHGKLRGKLGEEMEKALSFYIGNQELIERTQQKEDFHDAKREY